MRVAGIESSGENLESRDLVDERESFEQSGVERTGQTHVSRSLRTENSRLPHVILPVAEVGGVFKAAAVGVALVAAGAVDVVALLHTAEG